MTRQEPTAVEEEVGRALREHFSSAGRLVSDLAIQDRPDVRITIDGVLHGFELVQVPPHPVMQMVHKRFSHLQKGGSRVVRLIWPLEPHHWVADAIVEKQKKLAAYRANVNGGPVSLVVHSPLRPHKAMVPKPVDLVLELMGFAAANAVHGFQSILLWDPRVGVHSLFPHEPAWRKFTINFDKGYPTNDTVMTVGSFSTPELGSPEVHYRSEPLIPSLIVVPPTSVEFRSHAPRYVKRRYRAVVTAGPNSATIGLESVEEESDA